jgi:putative endonuclease
VPLEHVENLPHHAEHPLHGAEHPPHDSPESPASARGRGRRRALGQVGEAIAVAHLEARGFALLDRNYRTRRGEIDLIAFDGRTLTFVEVKTQQMEPSEAQVRPKPLEWLTTRQQKRRRPLAMAWLYDRSHPRPAARHIRFDAIGVVLDEQGSRVALEHLEGVE